MTNTKDQMVWGNRTVATIGIRFPRNRCIADLSGLTKQAAINGRAASQWVKPKMGRKRRVVSRSALSTSFPLNSKVQAR